MDYHAVEGSPVIVEQLHERFPEYTDTIKCGDFTKEILFDGCFDLIVDRASLLHVIQVVVFIELLIVFKNNA